MDDVRGPVEKAFPSPKAKWMIASLSSVDINVRLNLCFMVIIALMFAGTAITLWQSSVMRAQEGRLREMDEQFMEVQRIYALVRSFRDESEQLVGDRNLARRQQQASALRNQLNDSLRQTQTVFRGIEPKNLLDPTVLSALETIQGSLPAQIDSLTTLGSVANWDAQSERIEHSVEALQNESAELVNTASHDIQGKRSEANREIERAQDRIIIILSGVGALTILVAGLLGFAVTESITRPLRSLVDGASALASGEFGHQIHVQGRDELAQVSRVFNQTVLVLRRLYEDLRNNEQALRKAIDYLAEAQRLGHIGNWIFDPARGFEYWSDELFRIHGLDPDYGPPNNEQYLAAVHPHDRDSMASLMKRMLSDDPGFDVTKRIVRPNGEVRYVRCVGTADFENDPSIRIGVGIDVTEHEVLTQELRHREAHLAEAQRLGHIGSWIFEPTGTFEYWSHELFRIYGLDSERDAPTLDEYLACVHPHDREFMSLLIKRMVAEASGCDVTKRIVRPDGEVRYIRCVGASVLEHGKVKRIVGNAIDVTEHELLTQELRRREAYLAEAQRLSHTGSFGWNLGTGEIVWSEETYRIFEYDHARKPTLAMFFERLHPEDWTLAQVVIDRASDTGDDFEHEYRLLLSDGRVKYVHAIAHALKDACGNREFVGAVTDITERKTAEEKISRSERELRALIEAIPAYVGTALPDGSVDFISQSWLDYSGQTREEAMGWGWAATVHPDDVDRPLANLREGLIAGEQVEQELRCRRADGAYHWFLNRSLPLRDDDGKIVKWYGILFDINALKETESALQTREHELLGVIETIPSMLWSTSPTGEPTRLSQRLLEYLGVPFEEIGDRGWVKFVHPDDREETAKAFFRAIESGDSFSETSRLRRADGEYRWIHTMGEPLRNPHGKIIQWYGLSMDIDERKRAEDHLRDTRIKLAKASRLATVAELAGSIAHELNQPLMSILANAQAAKRWLNMAPSNLTETNSSIERIIRDARAADETMQHIRALFKQESFDKMDVDIQNILREVVRVVQEDPRKRIVPIECDFEERLPTVPVDPIQIQQVFINLIVNAIEALEGKQAASLVVLRAVADSCGLLIQVIDNGPGIDDPERIFDAFMTTKEKGMGIGLAVSRTIVEAHGGRLWAENDNNRGAIFNVTLPLSPAGASTV